MRVVGGRAGLGGEGEGGGDFLPKFHDIKVLFILATLLKVFFTPTI